LGKEATSCFTLPKKPETNTSSVQERCDAGIGFASKKKKRNECFLAAMMHCYGF
jgi:hypothetical protein